MKKSILIGLIFWMLISLVLALSVVGLLLFVRADGNTKYWQGDEGRSTWCRIGVGLFENLIK